MLIIFNLILWYVNIKNLIIIKQTIILNILILINNLIYYIYSLKSHATVSYPLRSHSMEMRYEENLNFNFGIITNILWILFFIILYVKIKENIHWILIILIQFNILIINVWFEIENIFIFFLLFEIFNIIVYWLLTVNSYNYSNTLIYYFISFIWSTFIILGFIFLYNLWGSSSFVFLNSILNWNSLIYNNNLILKNTGYLFIMIGLTLKLGIFPFHAWIYNTYKSFENNNLFYFLSLYKLSILLFMIKIILDNYQNHFHIIEQKIGITFLYLSIGTVYIGGVLLINQTTLKKFIIANSFVHLANLIFIIGLLCFVENTLLIINLFYLYIFFYIIIILLIGSIIWNKKIISNNNISLATFKLFIVISIIWILSTFPPFILFLIKYYILIVAAKEGFLFIFLLILILNSSIVLIGYLRILNSLIIRIKYK